MAARRIHVLNINLERLNPRRRRRVYDRGLEPFQTYTDDELRAIYRFGRAGIDYIVGLVANDISPKTERNHALSATMQVLVTLRFLASGSFLQVIGDTFLSFDKSTVSRVVRRVTQALAGKLGEFVRFPETREEKNEIKQGLFAIGGFPCAIGCVDGTHIRLTSQQCSWLQSRILKW